MTRFELKTLILECIDEKMEDIITLVIEENNIKAFLPNAEYIMNIRKDVNHIGRHLKLDLPSDDSPF